MVSIRKRTFVSWLLAMAGSLVFIPRLATALQSFPEDSARFAPARQNESVRAELARLQKQTGLTLAAYSFGLQVISFENRRKYDGKSLVPMEDGPGTMSPDGTKIALEVVRWEGAVRAASLGVVRWDGSDLQQYPGIQTLNTCWSHDQSKIAMTAFSKANTTLGIFEVASKQLHTFEPQSEIDPKSHFTSQCWSRDDAQLVYETEGNVKVYEIGNRKWRILAKGTQPTWSPDGDWIAYRDGATYFAIRPSGEDKKTLFNKTRAVSGLYWSPDSRFVAYIHQDFIGLDTEFYHLMVRRLQDNSEDWVANGVLCCINYQWVKNAQLVRHVESELPSH